MILSPQLVSLKSLLHTVPLKYYARIMCDVGIWIVPGRCFKWRTVLMLLAGSVRHLEKRPGLHHLPTSHIVFAHCMFRHFRRRWWFLTSCRWKPCDMNHISSLFRFLSQNTSASINIDKAENSCPHDIYGQFTTVLHHLFNYAGLFRLICCPKVIFHWFIETFKTFIFTECSVRAGQKCRHGFADV